MVTGWKYNKEHKYWYKQTAKSQSALYLLSPKQTVKSKWMVRSDRYTKRSSSGKGTFYEFETKKQALNYIKKRTKK